jgi:AcrR family transcriptional regulator
VSSSGKTAGYYELMSDVQSARVRYAAGRGRIDKQRAVLTAALVVFARMGYAQARVDDIAAEANVAKATVYNHFGDKETLFRQAVQSLSETALAANVAAVDHLARSDDDLPTALTEVGVRLVRCYCAEESQVLRRLIAAEAARFPDLLDPVIKVSEGVTRALADRFARLALAGTLRIEDPDIAAGQFTALLTVPVDGLSRFGTRTVPDSVQRDVARSAVSTFLKAFGT